VLRINDSSDTIFIEALPSRVEKLTARGWKSEIDVRAAMAKLNRKRAKTTKKVSAAGVQNSDLALNRTVVFDYRHSTSTKENGPVTSIIRYTGVANRVPVRLAMKDYAQANNIRIVTRLTRTTGKIEIIMPMRHSLHVDKLHKSIEMKDVKLKTKGTF